MILATVTFAVRRSSSPWSNLDHSFHQQKHSSVYDDFEHPNYAVQHTPNASLHESPRSTSTLNHIELEQAKIAIQNTLFFPSNLMAMLNSEIKPVTSSPFAHHSISSHSMENDTSLYRCEIQLSATHHNQVITKKDIETFFAALKDEHGVNEAQLINYRIDDSVLFELKSMHKVAPTQTSALTHAPKPTLFQQCRQISANINPQAAHEAKWQTKKPETGKYAGYTVRLFNCNTSDEAQRIQNKLKSNQLEADILPGKKTEEAKWVVFKHH